MNQKPEALHYTGTLKLGLYGLDGVFGGFFDPINFMELSISPQGKLITQPDLSIEYFGEVKSAHVLNEATQIKFKLDEANLELMAAYLRATSTTFSQSASTAATATKVLIKDRWIYLGARNIGNVTITGKTAGTDFVVDPEGGFIKALTTGGAGSQSITFDKGAIDGSKIVSGRNAPIMLSLEGKVQNLVSGKTGRIIIPKLCADAKTAMMIVGGKENQNWEYDAFAMVPDSNSPSYQFGVAEPVFTFIPDQALTGVA